MIVTDGPKEEDLGFGKDSTQEKDSLQRQKMVFTLSFNQILALQVTVSSLEVDVYHQEGL